MRAYLTYVLWRTLFVLTCLTVGLLGWPGMTGADENLLNSGSIDASGARRITVTPTEPEGGGALGGKAGSLLSRVLGGLRGDEAVEADAAVLAPSDGMLGALADLPANMAAVRDERDKAMVRARAFGQMISESDRIQGEAARAERLQAEAEKAARPPTEGELLFAEFGAQPPMQTPYEASRAAMAERH